MTMEQDIGAIGNREQWRKLVHDGVYPHSKDSLRQDKCLQVVCLRVFYIRGQKNVL